MNFTFDAEQKSLGDVVGQVLGGFPALVAPDAAGEADDAVWRALAEVGLFALLVPEAQGGVGLGVVDIALAIEQLGAALASPLIAHTLIATDLLLRFGSDAQQAMLPEIAAGTTRIALATQDPEYSIDGDRMRAAVNGQGCDRILVPAPDAADWFMALFPHPDGCRLALVPRDAPGVFPRMAASLDPASRLGMVRFDALAETDLAWLADSRPNEAVTRLFDIAPVVYAGLQTGIAGRMLDASVAYAGTRVQFGRPIGAFQAIKHRCADLAVVVDAARTAAYYAFWAISENAPDATRASSMAKAYCGEAARQVCNEAIQIHGGMGFTWELGLHRFLRRAKLLDVSFGDPDWHYRRVLTETIADTEPSNRL